MPFNKNIPQPNDNLSKSQNDLLNNMLGLNSVFGVNHYPFDDGTGNAGFHTTITLPEQVTPVNTAANQIAVYSQDVGGASRLFMQQEANGTRIQLSNIDPLGVDGQGRGYTFLPGGLLLQYGTTNLIANTTTPVTFATPFVAVYSCVASTNSGNRETAVSALTINGFNFVTSVVPTPIPQQVAYWFAIGTK